jgi:hypothetical protein
MDRGALANPDRARSSAEAPPDGWERGAAAAPEHSCCSVMQST